MCTAISYKSQNHYFGRNLDLEYHYKETVVITPRKYSFRLRSGKNLQVQYAMIGMAMVEETYPLYYEATNECGLSMAGLNFPGNAVYFPQAPEKENITPYELIPWILGQCENIPQAQQLLKGLNITDIPFSKQYPLSPLHWILSDRDSSIVVEQTKEGLSVYDDPVNVLTNNPPFPYHLYNLQNYLNVTAQEPENRFSSKMTLAPYSKGIGGFGLPGDLSSASRFVRAAFTLHNSVDDGSEDGSVSQFFHILDSVAHQRGCCQVEDAYEITYYSSCCNTDKGIYYYKTYDNSQITAVRMTEAHKNSDSLFIFPLVTKQQVRYEN